MKKINIVQASLGNLYNFLAHIDLLRFLFVKKLINFFKIFTILFLERNTCNIFFTENIPQNIEYFCCTRTYKK